MYDCPVYHALFASKFTGKEHDTETGLENFGARYDASSMGRFMSPDPSNASVDFWLPQTWNRYAYTLDNPVTVVDRTGLWPWYIHDEIIDSAFPGLSDQESDDLKSQSGIVDLDQSPEGAYQHGGMTNGVSGQSASDAQQQEDNFIASNEHDAQQLQANWEASGHTGLCPAALTAFGNALHAVTDAKSPSHRGNKPWYGTKGLKNEFRALVHISRESIPTPAEYRASVQAAQATWIQTFGHEFDLSVLNRQPPPSKPCTWNGTTNTLTCPQ